MTKFFCYGNTGTISPSTRSQLTLRKTEREWDYSYANKSEESITIADCVVKLKDVYAGVEI